MCCQRETVTIGPQLFKPDFILSQYSPHQTVVNYNAGGKQDQLMLGILFMAVGETLIVMGGAAIKQVTDGLPVVQVMFFRNFFGLLLLLPLVLRVGLVRLKTDKLAIHFQRAVYGVIAMFCMFYSFHTLKLTEAVLLKATSPILLSLIAWVLLRERVSKGGWCAIVLAFVGVVIIVNPSEFDPVLGLGFLAGLTSALVAAFAKIMVRKLGQTEPSDVIVFYFMAFGTLFTLPLAVLNWQAIDLHQWGLLLLVALFSTAGQLGITKAYSLAQAGQVSMFTYLSMPAAGLLGWVFWKETITFPLVAGTAVIIAAGVLSVYSSRASAQRQTAPVLK